MAAAMSARMPTAAISRERVLTLRFMASIAYITAPISRLIALEMIESLRPAIRHRSSVPVMRIEPVIDMPVKAMRTVKPRACSKKHSAHKPIRPVVAVRSAVVRGIVKISVRAHRSYTNIYPNANLSWRHR